MLQWQICWSLNKFIIIIIIVKTVTSAAEQNTINSQPLITTAQMNQSILELKNSLSYSCKPMS